jgi:hypothetical protein
MRVVITEVVGIARVRDDPSQPWRPATAGMELSEGAEIHTGVRSRVGVKLGDDQAFTIDRLGVTQLLRAKLVGGVNSTDVAVKYGKVRYEVEAAGREHEAVVRSPSSTLAVRGTVFELYDQPPFTTQAISYEGRVMVRNARRQTSIGTRGVVRTVRIDGDKDSAAETALAAVAFDPAIDAARTPAEQRLIEQVISNGGLVFTESLGGIPVVTGGTPLTFDAQSTNFPGAGLNFVLNWTGNADLNLTVALPGFNDLITPVTGFNRGSTGGVTAFDHRGGPNGGFEIVFFPQNYPGSDCIDIPGPGNNPGTEDYITSIDFIRGVAADVKLDTFVRDPVTGNTVLVQRTEGTVNQSVGDSNFAPNLVTTSFVDDAVCAPPSAALSASRTSRRGPQVLTGGAVDRSCGGWQTMVEADRARRAKTPPRADAGPAIVPAARKSR